RLYAGKKYVALQVELELPNLAQLWRYGRPRPSGSSEARQESTPKVLFAHLIETLVPAAPIRAEFPPQLFPCPELILILVCGCGRPTLVLVADSMSGRKDFPIGGQGPRISHRSVPGT